MKGEGSDTLVGNTGSEPQSIRIVGFIGFEHGRSRESRKRSEMGG